MVQLVFFCITVATFSRSYISQTYSTNLEVFWNQTWLV